MSCGHRCNMVCHKGPCARRESCKKKILVKCPCNRQKKRVQCFMNYTSPVSLSCDDDCIKVHESHRAEKLRQEEEEKKKQEKELELFLQKRKTKKRQPKICSTAEMRSTTEVNYAAYRNNFFVLSVVALCITGIIIKCLNWLVLD